MNNARRLSLFEAFGVELEYMVVAADTLDVRPVVDELFHAQAGDWVSDVERGPVTWSNELVAHVVELKTTEPSAAFEPVVAPFEQSVAELNAALAGWGCRLLPGAAHPWMDPRRETRLWPHESREFYEAFDRIFDCRRHGWANLQSVHLNLPFAGDEEFARLHAAVRLLLPLLPAIAASSPVLDGRMTGLMDARLEVYRHNSARIPSLTGRVIPEPLYSQADYQREVFDRIYADVADDDPDKMLREEWLNARGAIARFGRGSIEIRVLDVQEQPAADVAICAVVANVLREIVAQRFQPLAGQQSWPIDRLEPILLATIRDAERAVVSDAEYLAALGFTGSLTPTAGEVWGELVERCGPRQPALATPLDTILRRGPLARRIAQALGSEPSRERLAEVYRRLADCLAAGQMFVP